MKTTSLTTVVETNALFVDVAGALLVHALYRKYEVNPSRILPTSALLLGVPSISSYLLYTDHGSITKAFFVAFSIFYATLLSSIVIYRISPFHPLASYPGPFLAKISKFYGFWIMSTGKHHLYLKRMHERYGSYVRVGPNELSVRDSEHIIDVLGSNGLPRGPMWDAHEKAEGSRSLLAIRDQREHTRRRKPWNRAFSTTAVKDYEPIVRKRAQQLIRELEKKAKVGMPVDLTEWIKSFTFDFMGDLVFGGGFEVMRDGAENEPVLHAIERGLKAMAILQHVPWILKLLRYLPGSTKSIIVLQNHASARVKKRLIEGSHAKDLYSHFLDEKISGEDRPSETDMISDGLLAILAGYDTTATVLAALFHYVLCNRHVYLRLQEELDDYFNVTERALLNSSELATLPYLNAVINEALRLGGAADAIQRSTTKATGAKFIGQRYIPEGTAIQIPLYTLLRDPASFSPAPDEFRPERFLGTGLETPINGDMGPTRMKLTAFIPFSYGPENCAGKTLAIAELRIVTALIMLHFDMRFEDGYDPADWERDLEDWYVMSVGRVPVHLTLRASILPYD